MRRRDPFWLFEKAEPFIAPLAFLFLFGCAAAIAVGLVKGYLP